jgi:hypothetical protein
MATTTNIATMAAINKSINNSINLIDEITTTIKDWERKFTQFCLDHKQAEQRYADLDPLPPNSFRSTGNRSNSARDQWRHHQP